MLDDLLSIPQKIVELLQNMLDVVGGVLNALVDMNTMLGEFDDMIIAMRDSCGSSAFTGLPIVDAIGTFRYLVGDVAFYMIYFTILIGCLLTIYKLVVLLYDAISALIEGSTGGASSGKLSGLLTKLFK